jgi:hypothetical protein
MEVYRTIKNDLLLLCLIVLAINIIRAYFNIGVDDTDANGWKRSGFELLTDYGTGKQYLYKNGVIIERKKDK